MGQLKRIGWVSPVDTAQDSIGAYCTSLLLPLLRQRFDIELFSDLTTTPDLGVPHHHHLNAYKRHRTEPFDLFFYLIEDGVHARFTRTHLGIMPGVVWLHDILLSDLGAEAFHSSPWEYTLAQFENPGAPFNRRDNPVSPVWPEAYREISLASTVLYGSPVSLREASRIITRRMETSPGSHRSLYLPPPVELGTAACPIGPPSGESLRALRLAAANRATVAGQMHKVFSALETLDSPWQLDWMVDPTEMPLAEALLAEYGVNRSVTLHSGRSPAMWHTLLERCVATIHLHHELFHHLSPYLHQSVAAGRPAVVSALRGREELPADVVFQVEPGFTVTAQLRAFFDTIIRATDPGRLGLAGQIYITRTSAPPVIADRLAALFETEIPRHKSLYERWGTLQERGLTALTADLAAAEELPCTHLIAPFVQELRPRFE